MELKHAQQQDLTLIYGLYRAAIGRCGCTWDENYPGETELRNDAAQNCLYAAWIDGQLIGAVSVVPENEADDLEFWQDYRWNTTGNSPRGNCGCLLWVWLGGRDAQVVVCTAGSAGMSCDTSVGGKGKYPGNPHLSKVEISLSWRMPSLWDRFLCL